MSLIGRRSRQIAVVAGVTVVGGLSLFAQSPAPPPAPPAQQQTPAPGGRGVIQPPAGQAGAPGARQGGGGRSNVGADWTPKPPVQPLTPAEQARHFIVPAGYRVELVAADPDIISPAVIDWDGNGRMYVSEFRSYMLDLEATREHDPINRISRWEDTDGDGIYDKHTVFADNLVFPRMILPLDDGSILTNETHSDDVLQLWDTNGDGVADRKQVFYTGVGRGRDGNVEHEQSGFVWALDNWIYSTYNAFRFRWTPEGIRREPTGPNGASWGLTQDNEGKPWFINAGGERGPVNFQVPIHYGAWTLDDGFESNFQTVWPAPSISDMQGGMGRVRQPIGALNHFTATAGAEVYRADRLPEDVRGDLFFTEPVGRLVRRAKIVKTDGLTQLRNANPGSEFLLSTDPLFRPVNIKTGPDGALYIADMYHGIIQEAQWTPAGSYLRAKIQQYQLDKVVAHGRIWRVRYDGTPASPASLNTPVPATAAIPLDLTRPRMLDEAPAQLVAHLSHPNGWWRDTAQRLLILEQDKSVVPSLQALVRTSDNLLGRFHALWTLEGLQALDAALVRQMMEDANPRMRVQAIRASESLYKAGDKSFAAEYRQALRDPDTDVVIQGMLTMNVLKVTDAASLIRATSESSRVRGVTEVGKFLLSPPPATAAPANAAWTPEQQRLMEQGATAYTELCFECHGSDGLGEPMKGGAPGALMAPPVAGSPRVQGHRDYVIKTLLHGLAGPVGGQSYAQVMIPMGSQTDEWIAAVGSYVRNSFGNTATFVSPSDVARVRAATKNRKTSWTVPELEATLPQPLQTQARWTVTASHNPSVAPAGLTFAGWTSGVPQQAGMWYQVELPEPTMISEVQFDAAGGGRLGSTARGRGAAPDAPPPPLGFPREYQVQTSMDGKTWSRPVATGQGSALTLAAFTPVRAKFVRITQTATTPGAPPWVIQNLRILAAP